MGTWDPNTFCGWKINLWIPNQTLTWTHLLWKSPCWFEDATSRLFNLLALTAPSLDDEEFVELEQIESVDPPCPPLTPRFSLVSLTSTVWLAFSRLSTRSPKWSVIRLSSWTAPRPSERHERFNKSVTWFLAQENSILLTFDKLCYLWIFYLCRRWARRQWLVHWRGCKVRILTQHPEEPSGRPERSRLS